jgi:hypothetical protein
VSCIETSTICPRPVRSRWNRAALIAAEQVDAAGEVHERSAGLGRRPVGSPVAAARRTSPAR